MKSHTRIINALSYYFSVTDNILSGIQVNIHD